MAKNAPSGDGHRRGAVSQRSQFRLPSGLYAKRNTETGRIMDVKTSGGPFKGVRREK
jgi:hypothetical protein